MIFLNKFVLMNENNHCYLPAEPIDITRLYHRCTPDEYYPLGLFNPNFTGQRIEQVNFDDITIFYGGNGSGKTTLLNIMAEKLEALRFKKYLQTEGFAYYIDNCEYEYDEKPLGKKFIASDDIFDYILTVREENKGVKQHKQAERQYSWDVKDAEKGYRHFYPDGVHINFEDPEVQSEVGKFRCFNEARRKSTKQFVRSRAGEMQRQFSNGENALMFFDKNIENDALYFLDEPENSMSPKFQLELKTLIEDSVRYKNCQFVIATHSPFILSLYDAKIYNLDASPVTVECWNKLENLLYYYDFFKMN
jgi:predicted ATPase